MFVLEFWNQFKTKWFYPACGFFVATVFVFLIVGAPGVSRRQLICFFGFAVGMAAASKLLYLPFGAITRYLLHACASLVDFILFVLLLTGYTSQHGFGAVGISVAFLFFYALIMGFRGLLLWLFTEKEKDKKQYERCFPAKKKD